MKQGIDNNFGYGINNAACAISYVVIGLVYTWKLALVLLTVVPFISACAGLMYIMSKKYKDKELKAYEEAGQTAQTALTSIKTVNAFNLQQRFLQIYKKNLKQAQLTTTRKGLVFGLFNGALEALLIAMLAMSLFYSTFLIQNECETFSPGSIVTTTTCLVQSFLALGNALSFSSTLSQGTVFLLNFLEII